MANGVASRAMTCFLGVLLKELPAPVLKLAFTHLAPRLVHIDALGCTSTGEADVREQLLLP